MKVYSLEMEQCNHYPNTQKRGYIKSRELQNNEAVVLYLQIAYQMNHKTFRTKISPTA